MFPRDIFEMMVGFDNLVNYSDLMCECRVVRLYPVGISRTLEV